MYREITEENGKYHRIKLVDQEEVFEPLRFKQTVLHNYMLSNYGRLYSLRRSKFVKPRFSKKLKYTFYRVNHKRKKLYPSIDKLVAYTFVNNPHPRKYKHIRHLDGNKFNHRAENLEWYKLTYVTHYDDEVDTSNFELIADDEVFAIPKVGGTVYIAYLISNYGRLYSRKYNKFCSETIDLHGYSTYKLYINGKQKCIATHILVANAFVYNSDCAKHDTVNHKDENRTNNYYLNLEWCDNVYNINYNDALSKRRIRRVRQYDSDGMLVREHANMTAAAEFMGVCMSAVRGWCGRDGLYRGYYWERVG